MPITILYVKYVPNLLKNYFFLFKKSLNLPNHEIVLVLFYINSISLLLNLLHTLCET